MIIFLMNLHLMNQLIIFKIINIKHLNNYDIKYDVYDIFFPEITERNI